MSDLTFTHLHMTKRDLLILETFNNSDVYLSGDLPEEELEIPAHMVPPNPDDSDILPSQVHPSYPYGNPTNIRHPAAKPRKPHDPNSRALFDDLAYSGGVNGALRWKDLALDILLPVNREKEEAERAALARKMASGTGSNTNPSRQQRVQDTRPAEVQQDDSSEEEAESSEVENDNTGMDSGEIAEDDDTMNENLAEQMDIHSFDS